MKKFIKLFSLCLAVLFIVSVFSSCGSKNKLIGTWVLLDEDKNSADEKLILADDGTGTIKSGMLSSSLTWSAENGQLFITSSVCGMTNMTGYSYKIFGDVLILTDENGEEQMYRKIT
ncbi:MAG: hypothetical protein KBS44_07995 [Clostridiales bacterium]|nr:hypothetical protein [Candidatus Coliplasma equi]